MKKRYLIPFLALLLASSVFLGFAVDDRSGESDREPERFVISSKEEIHHDMSAYTQGLFFYDGYMYESTGQYGESSFRKVDPATGKVLQSITFPEKYFVEGACVFDGRAYILTWYEGTCFVYDINTFNPLAEFPYSGQGWGITSDGSSLIMSNGSSVLSFRDPLTFMEQRTVTVRDGIRPVNYVNELEYIDGKIWANIYGLDKIFIIEPSSGNVIGKIDCSGLLDSKYRTVATDVLNGIAYNPQDGSVYLTGKYWPRMYKVKLELK